MARVAIVLVTWNSSAEIGGCLAALKGLCDAEVLVVDNCSGDRTREEVAACGVRLIANPANAGFAVAVNQGVRATTAPLVLLLNPDAHLVKGIDAMATLLETPGTGVVGGMLIGDDGLPQTGFMARNLPTPATLICEVLGINRLWPRNSLNWHYRCLAIDPETTALVDQPAGAFLMFSRAAWETVGGFDERFWPVWFEDVDFCARIKAAGFRAYYHPEGVARHTGGHSISQVSLENREIYWYGSLLEYAEKHYSYSAFQAACGSVVIGAAFRAAAACPRAGLQAFAVYGSVIGLALRRLFGSGGSRRSSVV
jgi:N-acetylglucosaminyl-diphospho-decaprenol L-rhamnosyltransferase